jgi:2-hydroxy fatty acid dioxygenase
MSSAVEKPGIFDINQQLTFYRHYHHQSVVNFAIHVVCVPILHVSLLVLLSGVSSVANVPLLVSVASVAYCIILDLHVAVLLLPYLVAVLAASSYVLFIFPSYASVFKPALALHLTCWALQILGHTVFEKNAPAILDSFVSAVLTAPLFVILELLFMCGFAPKLKARLQTNAPIQKSTD